MNYRQMIKQVQIRSGFSDRESQDALQAMVESLSVHLTEGERRDFASQLPQILKDIALSVRATEENSRMDLVRQFMLMQGIDEFRAKKQILSAWNSIKMALSVGAIEHIRAQLPNSTVAFLH